MFNKVFDWDTFVPREVLESTANERTVRFEPPKRNMSMVPFRPKSVVCLSPSAALIEEEEFEWDI
jgi:hypothetical protein